MAIKNNNAKENTKVGDYNDNNNPFRVLGIAMIVDQRGVGARLVARYPTSPASSTTTSSINGEDASSEVVDENNDDLFFTLTTRQMAKLFRTKKTLCGQPMTLSVNGTVFCCRAVLMHGDDTTTTTTTTIDEATTASESKDQLLLFSVIVALSSPVSHTSIPFSSWLDAGEDQLDLQRYLKEASAAFAEQTKRAANGGVSSAFLSIRRVHISLARYCRVLEREDRRCHYVSLQAKQLFLIRNDRQKKWEEQKIASGSPGTKQGSNNASSSGSVMSTKSSQTTVERRGRHIRTSSVGAGMEEHLNKSQQVEATIQEEQEKEQEILELMLAAPPPEQNTPGSPRHHGNLVRELVQMFHSLSRNDQEFPPTPTALLCERDGVVFVNQHIAIPVEAASLKRSQTVPAPAVRPYYTLLFPHASPSELLQALQSSGSAAPQRLQQLLLTVNPQKPLTEIAIDANLPLYTTMEIASYLVTHGACVTSPVVSRQSRLACLHIEKIPELALEFSQTFASVNYFCLVSFLTSSKNLGEAMSVLTNVENEEGAWLRDCLAPHQDLKVSDEKSPGQQQQQQQPPEPQARRWVEEMEELLYAMAIWLLSHSVLTQMQEYLLVVDGEAPTQTADPEESLFRELLESDVLNGDISIIALSWRLGLDQQKLRSWGMRHGRIRVVSRVPASGDDWESEPSSRVG